MPQPRRVILLGSTGSIGENTLEVIRHQPDAFDLVGLAAGTRGDRVLAQANEFGVANIALAAAEGPIEFSGRTFTGPDAARELIEAIAQPGDMVVAAIVGFAGIGAVLAAIEAGCDIALANKETLVAAGALVIPRAAEKGVLLLPVDSEHSGVFQCLHGEHRPEEIRRLVLTASGGPFRGCDRETVRAATPQEALNHPTWSMGPKVTIDSASMMNKALEVIEAHWLFGLQGNQIDVIVHPQSTVHAFVEFKDGSILAQMGPPDMKTPIQVAMNWPRRVEGCSQRLDWSSLSTLVFEPMDHEVFPSVRLAWEVIELGGTAGAIFNAANEVAVEAFLAEALPFGGIHDVVQAAIHAIRVGPIQSLEHVIQADEAARAFARDHIATATNAEITS